MTNLKAQAAELQAKGRNGDTMLAHINPQEAALLKALGGSGTINPDTGLPEFFIDGLISGGLSLVGGLFGSDSASDAANASANAQVEAARIAAEAQKFKPFAVTTGFGRSFFDTKKGTAGYEIDPVYSGFRDRTLGLAGSVFDQLAAADPRRAAAEYLAEQQGLLAPQRTAEDIALRQAQLGRGRIGLGLASEAAGAGMGGMVNPEQFSLNRARALADAEMAAKAREMGQADIDRLIARGTGLFQTGAGIEELGLIPLKLGAEMGGRAATAGANVGQSLLAGGQAAANALAARGANPLASTLMGLGQNQQFTNALAGLFTRPSPNYSLGLPATSANASMQSWFGG